jgi:hypothetical protein
VIVASERINRSEDLKAGSTWPFHWCSRPAARILRAQRAELGE